MLHLFFLIFLIFSHNDSHAVPASAGAPVTDVGVYGWLSKNLDKLAEQSESLNKMLRFSHLTKETMDKMVGGVIADNYNTTIDIIDSLERIKSNATYLPEKLQKRWDKELGRSKDVYQPFIDMEKYFIDRYGKSDYKTAYFREVVRDKAAQQTASRASKNLEDSEYIIKDIKELNKKINQTKSLKEASDLQNEMMALILLLLQKMSYTQEQLAQLKGINSYKAISETNKKNLEKYVKIKSKNINLWKGPSKISKKESYITRMKKMTRSQCRKTKKDYSHYKCASDRRRDRRG